MLILLFERILLLVASRVKILCQVRNVDHINKVEQSLEVLKFFVTFICRET